MLQHPEHGHGHGRDRDRDRDRDHKYSVTVTVTVTVTVGQADPILKERLCAFYAFYAWWVCFPLGKVAIW
jgi:hypothetical protein